MADVMAPDRLSPSGARIEKTVFVVDDNPVGRESLRWLLESADLSVETYDSSVAFLRQPPIGRRGCVVLDLRLRTMNGLDVETRLAKVAKARLPVVMISGELEESSVGKALRGKAFTVLERPFSARTLIDVVKRALDSSEAGLPAANSAARASSSARG